MVQKLWPQTIQLTKYQMVPYRFIFAFPFQHNWFRAVVKDEEVHCSFPDWRQDTVWCLPSFINGRVYSLCETEMCESPLMLPFRLIFIIIIIWRGKYWNNPVFCSNLLFIWQMRTIFQVYAKKVKHLYHQINLTNRLHVFHEVGGHTEPELVSQLLALTCRIWNRSHEDVAHLQWQHEHCKNRQIVNQWAIFLVFFPKNPEYAV